MKESKNMSKEDYLRLYEQQGDALFRHCFFRVSDRDKALDIVQETFLRVWRVITKEKSAIKNPTSFLYKIANNLIIDHYRKHKSLSIEEIEESRPNAEVAVVQEDIEQNAEIEVLYKALDKINNDYRQAFVMRYIDGMSMEEIAETLDCSENLVSVRLNRARNSLRKILNINI